MTLAWLIFQFAACALLIGRAGYVLSRSADRLAAMYGWGRGWVGLALLVTVTSLPELASGISAVAFVDAYVRGPLLADVSPVHAGTAVTALVMTGLVIIGLVMRPQGRAMRVLSWVSVGLVASYALNAMLVYVSQV